MLDRRQLLGVVAATGLGTPLFHRALAGLVQEATPASDAPVISAEMIKSAEWISGIEFTDEERSEIAASVSRSASGLAELRSQPLKFDDLPAMHFQPLGKPVSGPVTLQRAVSVHNPNAAVTRPASNDEIAFLPVVKLAELLRTRQITSETLTGIYVERLKKYNPLLNCVVTLTEDLAWKQARQADEEIAAGKYRGPLHGIPWGAKDLIAVPGYPTTWGIPQFETRQIDRAATVVQRLEQAGAVLVAKLSLGAIAMGDMWFRGMTRNPWNYTQGSSGSSAGSAAATVAGLVGFALGSETLGSIVSPSRRCGATGFRPTFGRVSRAGCMPLSWSMDKIGPLARSVEDCALVFAAIHGYDGLDPTVIDRPFSWPAPVDFRGVKVGFSPRRTRRNDSDDENRQQGEPDAAPPRPDLEILEKLGCELVEIELPAEQNQWALADVIDVEAASVFDDMLRARQTEGWNSWPGTFRAAQFVSALDYLRLLRRRRQLQFRMEEVMESVDFLVNCNDLLITNLTGHPSVVMPQSYREANGRKTPVSALLTGRLNDDDRLLALALAYQNELTAHHAHPPLDQQMEEKLAAEARAAADEAAKKAGDHEDLKPDHDGKGGNN
jgi:Asp-tRNA(Asn)/Glu-tRNA(Gln) amidotransferase A subunit family amidase